MAVTSEERAIRFRPTLVVGLGGTGHNTLVWLKAALQEAFGNEVFKTVRLLLIDTAEEDLHARGSDGRLVRLGSDEKLIIGYVPTTRVLQNLERYPAMQDFVSADLGAQAITAGAKQTRKLGRLALMYHFRIVVPPLEQMIFNLCNIRLPDLQIGADARETGRVVDIQGFNAFIITSVCGGTGSGIFLDVAYLIRDSAYRLGLLEEFVFVNAALVLPTVFREVHDREPLEANAYAALQELDYLNRENRYRKIYPREREVEILRRPFDVCYLVDAVNQRGKTLENMAQVAPMLADCIRLQIASQVGQAQRNVFDNIHILARQNPSGFPTAYSGLAAASLAFPAQKLIGACAARYMTQLLARTLAGRTIDPAAVRDLVNNVTDQVNLSLARLLSRLSRDKNNQPINVTLDQRALRYAPPQRLAALINEIVHDEELRIAGDYQNLLEQNRAELVKEVRQALTARVQVMVSNPDLGLVGAIALLDGLGRQLGDTADEMRHEQAQLQDGLDGYKERVDKATAALQNALTGWFPLFRGRRVARSRELLLNQQLRRLRDTFELNQRNVALQVLADLRNEIGRDALALRRLQEKITYAQNRLAQWQFGGGRGAEISPLVWQVIGPEDVDTYYGRYLEAKGDWLSYLMAAAGGLQELQAKSEEELEGLLLDFGRHCFEHIREIRIEDVLKERKDDEGPEAWLQRLRQNSVPFWNFSEPVLGEDVSLYRVSVLGVDEVQQSIYAGQQRAGEQLAATSDRHRITMFSTSHGLPSEALQQFRAFAQSYRRYIAQGMSPHVIKVGGEANWRWFALGQAFDFIKRRNNVFYCVFPGPADQPDQTTEHELGQGLITAVAAFVNTSEIVHEVEQRVTDKIQSLGSDKAREVLQKYIQQPRSRSPGVAEAEAQLRSLAGAFMNGLK